VKKITVVLLIIGLLAAAYYSGFFKSDEDKIEDRMNAFLDAYNAGDINSVLESLDAKTRNTYGAYMNVGNALIGLSGFGLELSDMFALGVSLSDGETLSFENMEITMLSDKKASVSAIMCYQGYQDTSSQNVEFILIKENKDWYISG